MADYLAPSAGLEGDWGGASGTAGNTTLAAGTDVAIIVFNGYNFSSDTAVVTLDGNAADVSIQLHSGGDGVAIFAFANPTTGSSIAIAWSGMDAGDDGSWFVAGVENADATEIAATGFPDTGTDTSADPVSVTLTTVADDLAIMGAHDFNVSSSDIYTAGSGDTEIAERYSSADDSHGYIGYEKATTTTTTVSVNTSGVAIDVGIGVVVPTASAGGGTLTPAAILASL